MLMTGITAKKVLYNLENVVLYVSRFARSVFLLEAVEIANLNVKQEKFCMEYSKSGNATAAYKTAYSLKDDNSAAVNANRLLRNAKIKARLQELSQEIKQIEIADVQECQKILTQIARNKKTSAKDRVSAINILLKAQGAFSQNLNIIGAVPVVFSDEDRIGD